MVDKYPWCKTLEIFNNFEKQKKNYLTGLDPSPLIDSEVQVQVFRLRITGRVWYHRLENLS